ncbi:GNAT family N-acetyltransferase [Urechidicola vernalis]|uniref:GNAT family N-acetyltransferase n=1 Tax=Urechidicola vernalis TaxID=3075600 RepID=A0ABU2Y9G0_9FLAO|nr:GNAT family N-acetyltransferase [Urechidicola sp. P050]MDT0554294.1 GNAT family N-acetyltransferase [Urechidicola sp. P050]
MNHNFKIREIKPSDNQEIALVIRDILIEFGVPKVGTAYEDTALDYMFETYNVPNATYFVVEKNGKLYGGAGVMQLQESDEPICELQKMYFHSDAREKGIGSLMMETCLEKAKAYGFKQCYLETLPYMVGARKLYKKTGFKSLDKPMGNTGHFSCNMWMLKDL